MIRLKLKELLDERSMTRYQLSKDADIQYQTLDKYYKNKINRYDGYILSKICETLHCQVGDILVYEADES